MGWDGMHIIDVVGGVDAIVVLDMPLDLRRVVGS